MAGPSPGPLVSSSQTGSVHNVVFYLQQHGNGNQFGGSGEACHAQNGNVNQLSYMQASYNSRYRSDGGLNRVPCFPTDNSYSFDRDASGSYWSYQQQQQQATGQHQMQQHQQWQQWNQNDYSSSVSNSKTCWPQQQMHQQQVQHQQRHLTNSSCMGFNSYPQHQQQQSSYYRNNVVATLTVQSSVASQSSQSRTPSRCDSVRSETCDSHCSSGMGVEDMQQQYGMYQTYHHQQQQQMSQQFYQQHHQQDHVQMMHQQQQAQQQQMHSQQQGFWSSTSQYDVQQLDQQQSQQHEQQMDYFQQQQHHNQYYRQYMQQPVQHQQSQMQQQYYHQQQQQQQQQQQSQMASCSWERDVHQQMKVAQQRAFGCVNPVVPMFQNDAPSTSMIIQTPACSSSPVGADTTTTSPNATPYHHSHHQYEAPTPTPSPDESAIVQSGFVPVDDSLEQSIDEGLSSIVEDEEEDDDASEEEEEEQDRSFDETQSDEPVPVASFANVPSGWTRDVSAGSVTYISPNGYRVHSLAEAADYVQRDGTCKCGLPCPLRLQIVFNFDPSVANAAADEERPRAESTCCRHFTQDVAREAIEKRASDEGVKCDEGSATPLEGADVALIEADACKDEQSETLKRKMSVEFDAPPPMKMAKVQPNVRAPPSPKEEAKTEQQEQKTEGNEEHEELLGDLLDCIPDSMEEVLDRQKEAVAEAAAQAEKTVVISKKVAPVQQKPVQQPVQQVVKPQPAPLPKLPVPPMPKQQKIASVAPVLAPVVVKTKPPPLAIRPGTPATAARSRAKVAAELSAKNTKTRTPRRAAQTITIQGGVKMLQTIQPPQQQPQLIQQQQQPFWPANIAPLRTTSFPFTYQTQPGNATPLFTSATTLRPGMGPMTFLTPQTNGAPFANPSLPVITTRPALAPSGQVVHVLTTPSGPMLAAAPEPTVPILTVGPVNPPQNGANPSNGRGFTRTGKKRKSTPQTVASILQQAAVAPHPPQAPTQHPTLTLTPQTEPLVYNVQNFQQIQPQPTIQTLALMPDGKTYVVVNSQPGQAAPQPTQATAAAGHWLLSPRPAPGQQITQQTLIAPAPQPVNVFCTTTPSTIVLNGTNTPQVLQLQDGTILQTTTEQPNVLTTNYGSLFIRCPPAANTGAQIFTGPQTVRAVPIPIAPGRSPGRSPDSSSTEGVTSTIAQEKLVCGEATPPQIAVKAAQPSPVVQSSQIDSCVQEEDKASEKNINNNNNVQHWTKPGTSETNVTVNPAVPAR